MSESDGFPHSISMSVKHDKRTLGVFRGHGVESEMRYFLPKLGNALNAMAVIFDDVIGTLTHKTAFFTSLSLSTIGGFCFVFVF